MEEEIIKKIALNGGGKRISPQTGLLHYYAENPHAPCQDTIPIVENFTYAYALFRSKTVENIQEAKDLLEKLMGFEVKGNFPVYLHEFPKCRDSKLSSHLLIPLFYLLKDFSLALGESMSVKIRSLAQRIVQFLQQQKELPLSAKYRLQAFLGEFDSSKWAPKSPEEWGEYFLCCQMGNKEPFYQRPFWNNSLGVFIGDSKERFQEGYEPSVTLLDLFMDRYAKRALLDHPVHLKAALVHPWKENSPKGEESSFVSLVRESQRQCLTLYFGDLEKTHSLVLEAKKGSWNIEPIQEGWLCQYTYDEEILNEEDSMEWAFYLDGSKEHSIWIEGEKATLFHPGDTVFIVSRSLKISFEVEVDPKMGLFMGHILKGDRSFQFSKSLPYGGYDWKLGWRTIKRTPKACLTLKVCLISENKAEKETSFSAVEMTAILN